MGPSTDRLMPLSGGVREEGELRFTQLWESQILPERVISHLSKCPIYADQSCNYSAFGQTVGKAGKARECNR